MDRPDLARMASKYDCLQASFCGLAAAKSSLKIPSLTQPLSIVNLRPSMRLTAPSNAVYDLKLESCASLKSGVRHEAQRFDLSSLVCSFTTTFPFFIDFYCLLGAHPFLIRQSGHSAQQLSGFQCSSFRVLKIHLYPVPQCLAQLSSTRYCQNARAALSLINTAPVSDDALDLQLIQFTIRQAGAASIRD